MPQPRTGEKALRRVRALVVDAAICWARSESEAIAKDRAVWLRATVRVLDRVKSEQEQEGARRDGGAPRAPGAAT